MRLLLINNMKKIFIVFLFVLLSFNTVYALPSLESFLEDFFVDICGFPGEWLSDPTNMLYYGIIPFSGIWMIIYGFLTVLGMFGPGGERKFFYALLSFFIAFSTLPLHVFTYIVSFLFGVIGIWSVGIFIIMFVAGTWIMASPSWGILRHRGAQHALEDINKKIEEKWEELSKVTKELSVYANKGTLKPEDQARETVLKAKQTRLEHEIRRLEFDRDAKEALVKKINLEED